MGFMALAYMVMAVAAAAGVFQLAKAGWDKPMILNLPGAVFIFFAVISLSGWLMHDVFDGYMNMPAPDVPWYAWLAYMGIAVVWYLAMALLLAKWREKPDATTATK